MNQKFTCKEVSVIDTGMGISIVFETLDGDREKDFLIQKHFEDKSDYNGVSNVELSKYDEVLLGGFYKVEAELSRTECIFIFGENQLAFKFEIDDEVYKELKHDLGILAIVKLIQWKKSN